MRSKSPSRIDRLFIWIGTHVRGAIEYWFRLIEYLIASVAMATAAETTSNTFIDVLSSVTGFLFSLYVGWGCSTTLFNYLFMKRIDEGRVDVLRKGDFAWFSRFAATGLAFLVPQQIASFALAPLGRQVARAFGLD
jgi:hypothetical protein